MSEIKIIPTVMPTNHDDFVEKINRVGHFVKTIQIDVMDGNFVPSTSWPYSAAEGGRDFEKWQQYLTQEEGLPHWEDINFEVDLMVADQVGEAEKWIQVGVNRVIGHIEAFRGKNEDRVEEFLELKERFGVEVYLAIAPDTELSVLDPYLDTVDGIQFMGIKKIGYQGQEFAESILDTIRELREKMPDLTISVDGGVGYETAPKLVKAGANALASGSTIYDAENTKSAIDDLQKVVGE